MSRALCDRRLPQSLRRVEKPLEVAAQVAHLRDDLEPGRLDVVVDMLEAVVAPLGQRRILLPAAEGRQLVRYRRGVPGLLRAAR